MEGGPVGVIPANVCSAPGKSQMRNSKVEQQQTYKGNRYNNSSGCRGMAKCRITKLAMNIGQGPACLKM